MLAETLSDLRLAVNVAAAAVLMFSYTTVALYKLGQWLRSTDVLLDFRFSTSIATARSYV